MSDATYFLNSREEPTAFLDEREEAIYYLNSRQRVIGFIELPQGFGGLVLVMGLNDEIVLTIDNEVALTLIDG
jgi:hypothetical protein